MNPTNPPRKVPTASELCNDPLVMRALQEVWVDSLPGDPAQRHEEGGWIYVELVTGRISTIRAPSGSRSGLSLANPPTVAGALVVGTFHTHPNSTAEGWNSGPSRVDQT